MSKITNLSQIAQAHALFNDVDLVECKRLLKRIANNFEIDHDEYIFTGQFELYQPIKEMAEKLIDEGKPALVGDINYLADKSYLKYDIKTAIDVRSKFPYDSYSSESIDPDDEDEVVNLYFNGRYRFDHEGICSSTGNGGAKTKQMRDEIKKIINQWLQQEFGKAVEYDY